MQKKVTLLVGAGAVENAWVPIVKAIQDTTNRNINAENANSFFAQLIYLARCYSKIDTPAAKLSLELTLNNIKLLKEEICRRLREAQANNEIKARQDIFEIIKQFLQSPETNVFLVTTNWDTTVENAINKFYSFNDQFRRISCLYLHGDINSDIYLPTEITQENYRNQHEEVNFGRRHSLLINYLENSNTLIIYGLSMSPLDAELLQSIAGISEKNVVEIIIIDPNHKLVADNLVAIIDSNKVSIRGYCPSNLEVLYTYK